MPVPLNDAISSFKQKKECEHLQEQRAPEGGAPEPPPQRPQQPALHPTVNHERLEAPPQRLEPRSEHGQVTHERLDRCFF